MATLIGDPSRSRTLVGYCWPWTVRPGETLDFMVSIESSETRYRADLVRIICAESLSDPKMFKEQVLEAPFAGSYVGRHQSTHIGSYVEIAPSAILDHLESFTVQAMVMPTLLPDGVRPRLGIGDLSNEKPVFQDQHLVSRWDQQRQCGWALIIDTNGYPAFICGDGASVHRTTLGRTLTQDRWFFVMASYDAINRNVSIQAWPVLGLVKSDVDWPESQIEIQQGGAPPIAHEGPLRFAACTDGPGNADRLKPALCFSGRLDRVRLSAAVLDRAQASALTGSTLPEALPASLVGFWDFSRGIDSAQVHDLSPSGLNGETVNMPMRAVTGVEWDPSETDWRRRPEHYSAIHFHDDDLYDAEWECAFRYTVPPGLPSGIYAARLRLDTFEDYIPFFVAPARGTSASRVAVLVPTATYTAYTNATAMTRTTGPRRRRILDEQGRPEIVEEDWFQAILQDRADAEFLLKNVRTLGKGIYANHTDGTVYAVASQKHVNMTVKPQGVQWNFVPDTLITDWLERNETPYDIITDELLHREGLELLTPYKVVMTGNHPEYYSGAMLDGLKEYTERGGRLMYLGGGGFWWVTSFSDRWPGAIEARKDAYSGYWRRYELRHAFDGQLGGRWEDNGRPTQSLLGVGWSLFAGGGCRFEGSAPFRRLPDSHNVRAKFIFDGVSQEIFGDYGVMGHGAAGFELDCVSSELGTPAHALHLARAAPPGSQHSSVSMLSEEYALNETQVFGDIVYFETPNGGAVFSVGSMAWTGSLSYNHYKNDVARITENVLRRFMDDTPIVYP